jgi:hypothetical protein
VILDRFFCESIQKLKKHNSLFSKYFPLIIHYKNYTNLSCIIKIRIFKSSQLINENQDLKRQKYEFGRIMFEYDHWGGWMVLIQSFTSWILWKFSIIESFGPLTDSGTLLSHTWFQTNNYGIMTWAWNVSNSFIKELKSRIGCDHKHWNECENTDSVRNNVSWTH